ncbi:hypothetical protein ACFSO7_08020 [Bacillus sp. CGMCC 1.16607]
MKNEPKFPSREHLDQAFTILQDKITRIAVEEEEEMLQMEQEQNKT